MKNLAKQLENEVLTRRDEKLASIRKIETNEAKKLDWYLLELLPANKKNHVFANVQECKKYLIDRLEKLTLKKLQKTFSYLDFNENLPQIESLTITVEWKRSQMWGINPTAEAYVSGLGMVSSGSISGCGYDKQSTAVANVLNQVPQFLKLMYKLKNKNSKLKNNDIFGYGSGYGILPSFEGGVGVNCYNKIFNSIGYEFTTVSSGKNFDVYKVTKIN